MSAASAASFQTILGKALSDYYEQIGVNLDKNPFPDELRDCNSPDDVLKLFEDKAKAFKVYRDGNRKLINWLSPVVQVVHALSGFLGEVVSKRIECAGSSVDFHLQVPFPPAQAIFVGVDVLITVRFIETLHYFSPEIRIYRQPKV